MDTERRSEGNQALESLDKVLNEAQLLSLNAMEKFGWVLAFIRKPLFQDIIPVMHHPDKNQLATLEDDGALNTRTGLEFR